LAVATVYRTTANARLQSDLTMGCRLPRRKIEALPRVVGHLVRGKDGAAEKGDGTFYMGHLVRGKDGRRRKG
jgi:hypothetical protein